LAFAEGLLLFTINFKKVDFKIYDIIYIILIKEE